MFDSMTHALARLAPEMSRRRNLVGLYGGNAVESFEWKSSAKSLAGSSRHRS